MFLGWVIGLVCLLILDGLFVGLRVLCGDWRGLVVVMVGGVCVDL